MPRFHDTRGTRVSLRQLPLCLRSLWQVLLRRGFGLYPQLPWIPFAAVKQLDRIVTPNSFVWEIGAGMSTVWFSRRANKIVSIEADKSWFERLGAILSTNQITNVELRYEWIADRMAAFEEVDDQSLDLLFIDGGPRSECLKRGFEKVKLGGFIYLDNWDVAAFWPGSEDFLSDLKGQICLSESFVGYVPGNFAVNQGLLLRKSEHPANLPT